MIVEPAERHSSSPTRRATALLAGILVAAGMPTALAGQEPLAIRVTAPRMNADVGENPAIVLAAQVDPPGETVAKVEFFDDGERVGTAQQAPFRAVYRPGPGKLNFRITARATDHAGHTVVSPPVTCVAASRVERRYRSYDYEETAEKMLKQVRLWIPEGLPTVRGILVVSNGAGGDTRDWHRHAWYGEFANLHGFAFLGAKGFTSHIESVQVMQHALAKIATASNHPELVNVPYVVTGFSAGGGYSSRLLVEVPDRVIASVPVCSRLKLPEKPRAASLATPACIISGELESRLPDVIEPVLAAYRPKGARFGWMTVQGCGHRMVGQEVLAMPLLDAAIRLRYPADADVRQGPVKLNALDPSTGWVADNTTWKSGLTTVAPKGQFAGSIARSSWLPSEDIAFIYRAYATYDSPLAITSPSTNWSRDRVWASGSNVTIVVDDARFPQWRKLAFYDGARKLGEINQGPPQFTATDLVAGFHAFSVLGTTADGDIRPSNPVLVIVRKPANANPAAALRPGQSLSIPFPDLPPTFAELADPKGIKPRVTVFLPRNYDPSREHPLLVFLNGGSGGRGTDLGVARSLCEGKDFVCLSVPLFIKDHRGNRGIIQDEDGQYMWPYFRTILERIRQVVPNIDRDHMVLGGFSNGSHAVQGLINESDGEIARRFSAFFVVEGGPRPQRWYLLKGKPYLMVISQGRVLDVMKRYCGSAKEAGVNSTLICEDIGRHGLPEQAYPTMRAWLIGPAMTDAPVSTGRPTGEEGATPRQSAGIDAAGTGAAANTLKTFAELMKSARISEPGEGPMTFFAPTDAAFAAMPEDKLAALRENPKAAKDLLLDLMVKQDISPGNLPWAGKMKVLGGGILTASPIIATESDRGPLKLATVNDAKVLKRIPVSKGRRVYVLDKVIFAEEPAADEQSLPTGRPAAGPAK